MFVRYFRSVSSFAGGSFMNVCIQDLACVHLQVYKVTQALFELYEKGREGPAPDSVHRYMQLVL